MDWDSVNKHEAEIKAKWAREGRRDYESGDTAKLFGYLTLMMIGAFALVITWPAVPFLAIAWAATGIRLLILTVKFGRKHEEPAAPVKKRGLTASERRKQRLAAARAEKATNNQGVKHASP